ncbi:uncharacterized protein C11orf42 homolog [Discoglossus pictus]
MAEGRLEILSVQEADKIWVLIRDKIVEKFLGGSVVPVPFLEDASLYDLLHVLVKVSQVPVNNTNGVQDLLPVGCLHGIVHSSHLIKSSVEHVPKICPNFCHEEIREVQGVCRYIQAILQDIYRKVILFIINPGEVYLQANLSWLPVTRIYIIYEVFYCSAIQIRSVEGDVQRVFKLEKSIPFAFSYIKYTINNRGALGHQKSICKTKLPGTAQWVKAKTYTPPDSPLTEYPRTSMSLGSFNYRDINPFRSLTKSLSDNLRPILYRKTSEDASASFYSSDENTMSVPLLPSISMADSDEEPGSREY